MSRHDERVRLGDMLDHAREACQMMAGKTVDDLSADRKLALAAVRLLEIVGEAAAHVSPATQHRLGGIRWVEIIGLRNRLVHGYADVDLEIVWQIVALELPGLIEVLEGEMGSSRGSMAGP